MKNLVKILALALALVMALALVACYGDTEETTLSTENEETEGTIDTTDLAGEDGDTYAQMDYMATDLSQYVTLGQYKGLDIVAERPIVSDAEIDAELQAVVDAFTTYEPYEVNVTDRVTERGDFVNISYIGTMDGVPFDGGSSEGDSVVLAPTDRAQRCETATIFARFHKIFVK